MRVTVRDLMTLDPVTVDASATIGETINLVLDRALNEVYVRDLDDHLLGVVSDYSLLKAKLNRSDFEQPIVSIMSRALPTLNPNSPLEDIAGAFRDGYNGKMAVVENGRVIGQLGRRDVLRAMLTLDELRTESQPHRRYEDGTATAIKPHRPVTLATERTEVVSSGA